MKSILGILSRAGAMWIIAGINAALFIASCLGVSLAPLYLGAGAEALAARPWSPLTYMFAQTQPAHFAINIIGLIIAGAWFQTRLRGVILATTYVAGGLAGALAFEALTAIAGTPGATLSGSSAAVLAVYAAITAVYGRRLGKVSPGVLGQWSPALPLCIIFVNSVFELWGDNPGGNLAHLAGILAGWAIGGYVSRSKRTGSDKAHRDIIDKFERSGYSGLTADERSKLFNHQ